MTAGITVEEALTRLRAGSPPPRRRSLRGGTSPKHSARNPSLGPARTVKVILGTLVAAPVVLGILIAGGDALGAKAPTPTSTLGTPGSAPAGGRSPSAQRAHHRASAVGGQSTTTTTTTLGPGAPGTAATVGTPATTPTTTTAAHPSSGAHPSAQAAASGGPSGAITAGSSGETTTTTSTTTTTAPGATTTTTTAPSPVQAWNVQSGAILATLNADIAAVEAATPVAGDYTAVVPVWQQLATDVTAAQALPAVPDPTLETAWTTALGELATASADWLGSLTSTAPPGGTIANQAQFDAGTAQFAQGMADFTTADSGIVSA